MSTTPSQGARIPAPRDAAEPSRSQGTGLVGQVRDEPGWLSMVEALDRFAASLVARLEHELTRADSRQAARLRSQLQRAGRLEVATAAAVTAARRARTRPPAASAVRRLRR